MKRYKIMNLIWKITWKGKNKGKLMVRNWWGKKGGIEVREGGFWREEKKYINYIKMLNWKDWGSIKKHKGEEN